MGGGLELQESQILYALARGAKHCEYCEYLVKSDLHAFIFKSCIIFSFICIQHAHCLFLQAFHAQEIKVDFLKQICLM